SGVGADGAADLAVRDLGLRLGKPRFVAADLRHPAGELQAERRRFGVDTMRAADLQRALELDSTAFERVPQLAEIALEERRGVAQLERCRGVPDVLRREAEVHPAAFVAQAVRYRAQER